MGKLRVTGGGESASDREAAVRQARMVQKISLMSQNPSFDYVVADLGGRRRRKLKQCAHLGSITFWHWDEESGDWSSTCELYLTDHGKYFTGLGPPPESPDTPIATTEHATWRTVEDLAAFMAREPVNPGAGGDSDEPRS